MTVFFHVEPIICPWMDSLNHSSVLFVTRDRLKLPKYLNSMNIIMITAAPTELSGTHGLGADGWWLNEGLIRLQKLRNIRIVY